MKFVQIKSTFQMKELKKLLLVGGAVLLLSACQLPFFKEPAPVGSEKEPMTPFVQDEQEERAEPDDGAEFDTGERPSLPDSVVLQSSDLDLEADGNVTESSEPEDVDLAGEEKEKAQATEDAAAANEFTGTPDEAEDLAELRTVIEGGNPALCNQLNTFGLRRDCWASFDMPPDAEFEAQFDKEAEPTQAPDYTDSQ